MRRREVLAGAVGGTALLTAGVGSAAAQEWWDPITGGDGCCGGHVVDANLEIVDPGEGETGVGAEVTCDGATVEIDGAVEMGSTCNGPALETTSYDGQTLTVSVGTEQVQNDNCSAWLATGHYVATVTTSSAPETVVVDHHDDPVTGTFRHRCGGGGETSGGSGDTDGTSSTGSGWTGGTSDGTDDGGDSSGGLGWW